MDSLDYRKDYLKIVIDLRNVKTERSFLLKMQEMLQLPSYFWLSFNSLDDCMLSLEWIDERQVEIEFLHLQEMQEVNNPLYVNIKESLEMYQNYWQVQDEKQVIFSF
ncbi:barstar [Capnocytophaga stomatis]|uniref:Barstar n=1 Tax=Capnocytophaga stomatis TaxID=1848904 RepID=A0A250FYN3_9FLAO|nr:barstar family protein [Capnocytophaga stomatis]ATA90111.1 barstar [Capnocytophaga stomatis]